MARVLGVRVFSLTVLGCLSAACTGDVSPQPGPTGYVPAQAGSVGAGGSAGSVGVPGVGGAGGASGAGGAAPIGGQAGAPPAPPAPVWYGSVGSWCGPGDNATNWLVLHPDTGGCETDAASVYSTDAPQPTPAERIVIQLTGEPPVAVPQTLTAERCSVSGCVQTSVELTVQSYAPGAALVGSLTVDPAGLSERLDVNANPCTFDDHLPAHPRGERLARDIALTEVAFYQAVKVPIMLNMSEVEDRNADLVQGREAFVRVFVEPAPEFQSRPIQARLRLDNDGMEPIVLEQTLEVGDDSSDEELDSTFNFKLEKSVIGEATTYSVELRETSACTELVGEPQAARFPQTESIELGARVTGPVKVLLVPIRFNTDGSGRLPDTSEEQIELFRSELYSQYPTTEVQISLREPVGTNSSSFSAILSQMVELRGDDDPPDDLSYYGMVRPADTFRDYCRGGCVAGIATFGSQNGTSTAGMGIGFPGETSARTFVHELGHVYRRRHSPCGGAGGPDPNYPYNGGDLGSWGWDLRDDSLIDPDSDYSDFMGYCDPTWISDYSYQALVERTALVNERVQNRLLHSQASYRTILVDTNGATRWGRSVVQRGEPAGEPESALVFDLAGNRLTAITVYKSELHDSGGALVMVPEPAPYWVSVQIAGSAPLYFADPPAIPSFSP